MDYKNSKNRYPQNRLTSVECILDMSPPKKTSKMENVYLYTIAEFTHLFVDIKHMRPVAEIPVADLTFWFNGGSINMVDPFLHLVAQQPLQTVRMERG